MSCDLFLHNLGLPLLSALVVVVSIGCMSSVDAGLPLVADLSLILLDPSSILFQSISTWSTSDFAAILLLWLSLGQILLLVTDV